MFSSIIIILDLSKKKTLRFIPVVYHQSLAIQVMMNEVHSFGFLFPTKYNNKILINAFIFLITHSFTYSLI